MRDFSFSIISRGIILIAFLTLLLASCELDPFGSSMALDNRSDYDVTVRLETGDTNPDGSMAFKTFSVGANSEKSVDLDDGTVYVKDYTPSDKVDMDFQESQKRIVFTNK